VRSSNSSADKHITGTSESEAFVAVSVRSIVFVLATGHNPITSSDRIAEIVMPVRDLLIALFFASCGQHLSIGFMRDLLGAQTAYNCSGQMFF
jgi:hypothetical protein